MFRSIQSAGLCLLVTAVVVTAVCVSGLAAEGAAARSILDATGVKGGLVVHVGCGDGKLTAALRATDSYLVQGLDADAGNVAKAREAAAAAGLAGKVTFARLTGKRLPYVDNLVTLLVAEDLGGISMSEGLRALRPEGVAYVKSGGRWTKTVKPRPKDIDDWTHFLHDAGGNAVAEDAQVGPPRHVQWMAAPTWSRNHHKLASISSVVSTNGRVFYIMDTGPAASMNVPGKWFIVARDAFSGVLLWERFVPSWAWTGQKFRSGPVQLPRTLVTGGDRVYLPLAISAPVTALDAATGEVVRTYKGSGGAEELVLDGGVLFVVMGTPMAEQASLDPSLRGKATHPNRKAVTAYDADTGKQLWQWTESGSRLTPLSLAAADGRAFFVAGGDVMCVDGRTGKRVWSSSSAGGNGSAPKDGKGRKKKPSKPKGGGGAGQGVGTMVVHDGVVIWADGKKLTARSAASGKELWSSPCKAGFRSSVDVLVVRGLVWTNPGFAEGRDLKTGRVRKTNDGVKEIWTVGHHHRCYREKATDRWLLTSYRGIEFIDLVGKEHTRNNWIRGVCQYGVMPCNGLVYAPAHACGCFMEAKLYGFWAVAPQRKTPPPPAAPALEKGPAFGAIDNRQSTIANDDWPTYRHDARRTGFATTDVPAALGPAWEVDIGGRLSAPVVAAGTAVVSSIDAHRVVALDAAGGKEKWTFATGGRVDSPPTIHNGLVLFGCADGHVYCVRLADGQLVWRFRAAPDATQTVALDQVESVWPVHGSVLVHDGVAYVGAGRSSHLDGGVTLYGLDPATGKVLCRRQIRTAHPRPGDGKGGPAVKKFAQNATDHKTFGTPDRSDAFSMAGTTSDVLVSDGTAVFLRQMKFDRKLTPQKGSTRHLLSTSRLLDDAENHRSHWLVGTGDFSRTPVAYSWIVNGGGRYGAYLGVPYGIMVTFDDETVWCARRTKDYGYKLVAETHKPLNTNEPHLPDFRKAGTRPKDAQVWDVSLGIRPRAMMRSGKLLLLGGMAAGMDPKDPWATYEGRTNGLLWVMSSADGAKQAAYKLDAPPVWDGMAAAGGKLYIATVEGKLICMGYDKTVSVTPEPPAVSASASKKPPVAASGSAGGGGRPGAAVRPDGSGAFVLKPETARTTGKLRYQAEKNNLGSWHNAKDTCQWRLQGVRAGTYRVKFAYGTAKGGGTYTILAGAAKLAGTTKGTGGIRTYKSYDVGAIALPAGEVTLTIQPGTFTGGALMNFRLLTLTPAK